MIKQSILLISLFLVHINIFASDNLEQNSLSYDPLIISTILNLLDIKEYIKFDISFQIEAQRAIRREFEINQRQQLEKEEIFHRQNIINDEGFQREIIELGIKAMNIKTLKTFIFMENRT